MDPTLAAHATWKTLVKSCIVRSEQPNHLQISISPGIEIGHPLMESGRRFQTWDIYFRQAFDELKIQEILADANKDGYTKLQTEEHQRNCCWQAEPLEDWLHGR